MNLQTNLKSGEGEPTREELLTKDELARRLKLKRRGVESLVAKGILPIIKATAGAVIVFFFSSWISIQRAEILIANRRTLEAEQRVVVAQQERDRAWRDQAETIKVLNERLQKAETARLAAEKKSADLAASLIKPTISSQTESVVLQPQPTRMQTSAPTAESLTAFIKEHLSHMTEPTVNAQLMDYADNGVEFHDKPHATLTMIENERKQTAQKYPSRTILKDEIQPQFSAIADARCGWVAIATFDYRWIYATRSGDRKSGITRDVWKIVPAGHVYKIIAEHSYDASTGVTKD